MLSKLQKISEYPRKIKDDGSIMTGGGWFLPGTDFLVGGGDLLLNDRGLEYSRRMRGDVEDLLRYLFGLKEDPAYLNGNLALVANDLEFLNMKASAKNKIMSLRSDHGIRKKKYDVTAKSLVPNTITFVDSISRRYNLSDEMGKYRDRIEEDDRRRKLEALEREESKLFEKVRPVPRTAHRDHIKDFMVALMDLGSERGIYMGSEIKEVFDRHYDNVMLSGAGAEMKDYLKNMKRNDVDFMGRDDMIRFGDITDKKRHRLIDYLKSNSI